MTSLAQSAYRKIRQRIASGELTTETLLSETSLALELQVSRTPVREAIRRLQSDGLLEQRPKQGTFVRAPGRREMRELFDLRIFLEPPAAARAARKRGSGLIQRLEELIDQLDELARRMETEGSPEEVGSLRRRHRACDRAFHETLIQESGNRRVCKIIDDAGILSLALGFPKDRPTVYIEQIDQANREHKEILTAIRQGEPRRAFRAMRDHLVKGRRKALDYFRWLREPGPIPNSQFPIPNDQ